MYKDMCLTLYCYKKSLTYVYLLKNPGQNVEVELQRLFCKYEL